MKNKNKKVSKKKIKFIEPIMEFNPGIMTYEPVLPSSQNNNKISRSEKINAWAIITLIIILILLLLLAIQVFF